MTEQKTDDQSAEHDADPDRPMPGPGPAASDATNDAGSPDDASVDAEASSDTAGEAKSRPEADSDIAYGEDETQDYVDRSKIDFDPEDGLYTGTAIEGNTDIPGPHQDDETTGDEEAMAEKATEMAKEEGTEDQIGKGASGSAVGKGQDGSQDDISGG